MNKRKFCSVCLICASVIGILWSLLQGIVTYYLTGEFIEMKSTIMPRETIIKSMNITGHTGYFIDTNHVLWATGRDEKEYSIGTKHKKGVDQPVKISEDIRYADNSLFITTENTLFGWNNIPYIIGMDQKLNVKYPQYIIDDVLKAKQIKDTLWILKSDGSLNYYRANKVAEKLDFSTVSIIVKDFCVEIYQGGENLYIIDQHDNLYFISDIFNIAKNISLIDKNIQKMESYSEGLNYLNEIGELYFKGLTSDSKEIVHNRVIDFSGGKIIYFIDDFGQVYRVSSIQKYKIENIENAQKVSSYYSLVGVLDRKGNVYLWGDNYNRIIPQSAEEVSVDNPVKLQEKIFFDAKDFLIRYSSGLIGIILLVILIVYKIIVKIKYL